MTIIHEDRLIAKDANGLTVVSGISLQCIDDSTGGDTCSDEEWDLKQGEVFVVDHVHDEEGLLSPMVVLVGSNSGPVFPERFKVVSDSKKACEKSSIMTDDDLSRLLSDKIKPLIQQEGVVKGLILASFAWQEKPDSLERWESFGYHILAKLVRASISVKIDDSALVANAVAVDLFTHIMTGFSELEELGILAEGSCEGDACPYFKMVQR